MPFRHGPSLFLTVIALISHGCGASESGVGLGSDPGALGVGAGGGTGNPAVTATMGVLFDGDGGSTRGPIVTVDDDNCGAVRAMADFQSAPVDVIWAIDGSCSMANEIATVADNIANFVSSVEASGADIHVVMLSLADVASGSALAADASRYLWQAAPVQSNNAFAELLSSYDGGLLGLQPGYSGFLRPDAPTHIIVVTDDESDMPASQFKPMMEGKLGHRFFQHAIASEAIGLGACPGAAAPGLEYYSLAADTGGEQISICASDWSSVFERLQTAVVATAEIPCDFPLPASEGKDLANVQVVFTPPAGVEGQFPKAESLSQCGDAEAWAYDDVAAPTKVLLGPAACTTVKSGGDFEIVFACEPPPVLI
jgi:hypothetical protein